MQHFAPHHGAGFEGYYSKFDLASGSHIALVISSIPKAISRSHVVSFTYYPASGQPVFQREHFVKTIDFVTTNEKTKAFELRVPSMGYMTVDGHGLASYEFQADDRSWALTAQCSSRTAWRSDKCTPEGWLVHLPLPLHWHVHSLCSACDLTLAIPSLGSDLASADRSNRATVHQEKNWASSFPEAHMWLQARDAASSAGICLAGGKILYSTAFLLGYRSGSLQLDFAPPFSLSCLNLFSPFMRVSQDWSSRAFSLSLSNYFHKLELMADAPKEHGWFGLAAPYPDGHRPNYCRESFVATVRVQVFQRMGWMPWSTWKLVEAREFKHASLEFAGKFYPERGRSKKN